MGYKYAAGKNALGVCDVCGFTYKLRELRQVIENYKPTGTRACYECWDPDHPQNHLGSIPVTDPQALRDPRSDRTQFAESRAIVLYPYGLPTTGSLGYVTVSTT